MNKDLLQQIMRFYFDSIPDRPDRFRGEIQRENAQEEFYELCYELELSSEFIESLKKDAKINS